LHPDYPDAQYYHFVTAVVATDVSGVEYRFICSDSQFSSGGDRDLDGIMWRNVDNVAGLIYPNGDIQTPQQYRGWVGSGVGYDNLEWSIIVRDRSPNENPTGQSAKRTISSP
jgi:hypothetical protein